MKKILIIDDIMDNLVSAKAIIKQFIPNSEVLISQSGLEGIDIARKEQPDTIILDIVMPRMDGYEVCSKLKKDELTKHIPVIMITAIKSDTKSMIKGLEVGADAFFTKPLEPFEISAQVNVMLRIKNAEDKLRADKKDLERQVILKTEKLQLSNELLKQDIKERKLVEQALKASELQLREIIEKNADGMIITDDKGNIEFVNKVATVIFQRSSEELLKKTFGYPLVLHETTEIEIINNHEIVNIAEIRVAEIKWQRQPAFLISLHDITQRKQSEKIIKKNLLEKETLLAEIHHRVKNNLQIIASLLKFQTQYIKDESLLDLFQNSISRVRSMAMIHQNLYDNNDFVNIDFEGYLQVLSKDLFSMYKVDSRNVKLNLDINNIMLDINVSVPISLIINELISNALKHAFPDNMKGTINVSAMINKEGETVIAIKDDGVGIPSNIDVFEPSTLGLRLVHLLAKQLNAKIEKVNTKGTGISISFKKRNVK